MTDFDHMSDQRLSQLAALAFIRGLEDGRKGSTPATADALMQTLRDEIGRIVTWRIYHKRKLRQVYGAGFDISRMSLINSNREVLP
jgi:hypothetical protein